MLRFIRESRAQWDIQQKQHQSEASVRGKVEDDEVDEVAAVGGVCAVEVEEEAEEDLAAVPAVPAAVEAQPRHQPSRPRRSGRTAPSAQRANSTQVAKQLPRRGRSAYKRKVIEDVIEEADDRGSSPSTDTTADPGSDIVWSSDCSSEENGDQENQEQQDDECADAEPEQEEEDYGEAAPRSAVTKRTVAAATAAVPAATDQTPARKRLRLSPSYTPSPIVKEDTQQPTPLAVTSMVAVTPAPKKAADPEETALKEHLSKRRRQLMQKMFCSGSRGRNKGDCDSEDELDFLSKTPARARTPRSLCQIASTPTPNPRAASTPDSCGSNSSSSTFLKRSRPLECCDSQAVVAVQSPPSVLRGLPHPELLQLAMQLESRYL